MELLIDGHFWVGVALVVFLGVLVMAGVHRFAWKALGDAGAKVQAQLDEAAALRREAQVLLDNIKAQREAAEKAAAEMLANAQEDAKRMAVEAQANLAEQIKRRAALAERKIASAEAQAQAEVKAAAAELAAQMAENVLVRRLAGATSDPLVDGAIKQLATKLQ
ncbi:ATP F0F1 synthase subunit B [Phenylobacterium sp.]|uniref:F0F1 ATP synthase subunit B family protein n=1 Tax=Phenylobacterium sp. TaxID=1871053 RepID=UPI002736B1B5|nr:ATP F0F1 synthase subunit B [Phenylobacterium sp.]MDP3855233.1 ATP F0F1 synthase subunit B [Phenylobacterium sp.]